MAVNSTEYAVLEAQVLTVADITSRRQHNAAQLLALWKQVLDERFPGFEGDHAPDAALQCLGRKSSEARRLITAFEEGLHWATSDGETGFAACRDLHASVPRIDVAMDTQVNVACPSDVDFGLIAVKAKTRDGDKQLCYLPSAGSLIEPDLRANQLFTGKVLDLHTPDNFEGWVEGGRRLAQHVGASIVRNVRGPISAPPVSHLDLAPRIRVRALDESCNNGTSACGLGLWCNVTTWQLEDVGHGYYSPIDDCSRYSCTSMDREVYGHENGRAGSHLYTASGGGADQCPWGCGGGEYAQAIHGIVFMCLEVAVGDSSPPGSKLIFQW